MDWLHHSSLNQTGIQNVEVYALDSVWAFVIGKVGLSCARKPIARWNIIGFGVAVRNRSSDVLLIEVCVRSGCVSWRVDAMFALISITKKWIGYCRTYHAAAFILISGIWYKSSPLECTLMTGVNIRTQNTFSTPRIPNVDYPYSFMNPLPVQI
jgi:hypothetical protein